MLWMHESGDLLSVISDRPWDCRKKALYAKNGCDSHGLPQPFCFSMGMWKLSFYRVNRENEMHILGDTNNEW